LSTWRGCALDMRSLQARRSCSWDWWLIWFVKVFFRNRYCCHTTVRTVHSYVLYVLYFLTYTHCTYLYFLFPCSQSSRVFTQVFIFTTCWPCFIP
jgi:hypothetical protein